MTNKRSKKGFLLIDSVYAIVILSIGLSVIFEVQTLITKEIKDDSISSVQNAKNELQSNKNNNLFKDGIVNTKNSSYNVKIYSSTNIKIYDIEIKGKI